MRRMDNASGEQLTVKQTYFITGSGVFLISASGPKDLGTITGISLSPTRSSWIGPTSGGPSTSNQDR